jgi:dTDP-4-amino-4,6-dideoxygalactose transaminase
MKYYNDEIGFNNRLDEMQAAFLRVKLNYLKDWTEQRKEIASWYNEALSNSDTILPEVHQNSDHVYHLYVIRIGNREKVQAELLAKGVQTMVHYPVPPYLQKAYKHLDYKAGDFPIADEIANSCLSLPLWPGMEQQQVELIKNII